MLSTKLKEAAGNSADATLYVDSVFSTYLYTGNGSTQTITNGIDLAGKGGMVWCKARSAATDNALFDTARGAGEYLSSNRTDAQFSSSGVVAFNSDGFGLSVSTSANGNGVSLASWTFRKAAKFFDVVTWTGDGVAGRTIAHSLGVAPGMIIVKRTNSTSDWSVYHRSLASADYYIALNDTGPQHLGISVWNGTAPTSSVFSVGIDDGVNISGGSYVAYLFAHDTDADGIIQCGSYTGNGIATGPIVNLGWEPQYLMVKKATNADANWQVIDSMRGMPVGSADATLQPNLVNAESSVEYLSPTATGFQITSTSSEVNTSGSTYIYMAIRRPNKPPTSGTQVFSPVSITSSGTTTDTAGFPVDLVLEALTGTATAKSAVDRLRGGGQFLYTNLTNAESNQNPYGALFDNNTSVIWKYTTSGYPMVFWNFKRAPGFFDEVCYTGTGVSGRTVAHNLTVAPELMIVKGRSNADGGLVYNKTLTANKYLTLFFTSEGAYAAQNDPGAFLGIEPTSSVFTVSAYSNLNTSASTYVAYLFATLAGISKVGSYTGNGSTGQAIACGFSAGARFVLIKRTDSTGDWYTFDSARGLTSGSSPYLLLNSTAAETTGNNGVYASTGGFTLATSAAGLNASGGTYIFLAVA